MTASRVKLRCNRWLIEQVFDKGKTIAELKDEYVERRASERGRPLVDLQGSMQHVITKERQMRKWREQSRAARARKVAEGAA